MVAQRISTAVRLIAVYIFIFSPSHFIVIQIFIRFINQRTDMMVITMTGKPETDIRHTFIMFHGIFDKLTEMRFRLNLLLKVHFHDCSKFISPNAITLTIAAECIQDDC